MALILRVFTLRYLQRGASLFLRAHIAFFVYVIHAATVISFLFSGPGESLEARLMRGGASETSATLASLTLVGAALYTLTFFPIRLLSRHLCHRWNSVSLRAQFGLLESVARLGKCAVLLLLATILWLSLNASSSALALAHGTVWSNLFLLLLVLVVAYVMAVHGWMESQFNESIGAPTL